MKKRLLILLSVLMIVTMFTGCAGETKTVIHLLNWGEYLEPSLISRFENENPDITIKQTTATSNEEMYAVISAGNTEIDVLVPSDYLVERMIEENLVAELDLNNIPNFTHVESVAKTRTFDPESKYSVPYMMGTLGIIYNTTMVDETVDSWDILWNPKYEKQILMYDSIRDSITVALERLGYDINTSDPAQIKEAADLLIQQRPLVLAYGTDDIKTSMVSESAALAVDYSGAAAAAIAENPNLHYVVPKEGSNVWVDNLVVMKSSKNKEAAERFINFLCDPEIAKINSEYIGYTTANESAMELIDPEMLQNPAYLITPDVLNRCVYYKHLPQETLAVYNEQWMRVLTS